MSKKKKQTESSNSNIEVVHGNHLTIMTLPDGRIEMEWDWDKLAADINRAIEEYETKKTKEDNNGQTNTVAPVSAKNTKPTGRKKKETKNV